MKRNEFLDELKAKLKGLPEADIEKAIAFYSEAIDDRIDDGLTEDQAVNAIGTPDDIAQEILLDTPLPKLVKAKATPSRTLKTWEIILIIISAPIWLTLLIVAASIVLSIIVTLFSLALSLLAIIVSLIVGSIAVIIASLIGIIAGEGFPALMQIGAAFLLLGISALLIIPVKAGVLWLIELIGKFIQWIKKLFIKKA